METFSSRKKVFSEGVLVKFNKITLFASKISLKNVLRKTSFTYDNEKIHDSKKEILVSHGF